MLKHGEKGTIPPSVIERSGAKPYQVPLEYFPETRTDWMPQESLKENVSVQFWKLNVITVQAYRSESNGLQILLDIQAFKPLSRTSVKITLLRINEELAGWNQSTS
jgi:hypothetical protein